ncbi:MAG: beta-lactamase family protein [Candidatus Aminicenantes bacterium]|nr:beta-lactamase family protein [Candidatus Aminicenantes bacterium]
METVALEPFVQRHVERGTFPGVTLLAAAGGRVLFRRHFGRRALQPQPEALDDGTLYDLASLTKPLVTSFLVAYFIERRQWRLEDEARRYLPGLSLRASLEQLLTHSAGFRPWHPFYLYRPLEDLAQMGTLQDAAAPGRRVVYSDVGYILLRHLLEKVSGSGFCQLASEVILTPLRLRRAFLRVPPQIRGRCAPTELGNCYEHGMCRGQHDAAAARFPWRTAVIRGEAHDANSFYAGGSAGNAGLFATAGDLLRLGREFFPASATLLAPETVALFWENRTPWDEEGRSIGFQLNHSPGASGGGALAPGAIGHVGITGTSLWLEAEGERQWIVLSNRVHPRVRKVNFNAVRRRLHHLLRKELGTA